MGFVKAEAAPSPTTGVGTLRCDRRPLLWALGACAVVLLAALPSLSYPLGRDQGTFAYIGDRWNHGMLPYRDAWDMKPPGVFAIYALSFRLFGKTIAAPRLADLVGTLLAALGLMAIARIKEDPLRASLSGAVFGLAYFACGYWANTEVEGFTAPVATLMVYSLLRARGTPRPARWWLLAGFCLGSLVLLKTPFALFGLLAVPPFGNATRRSVARRVAVVTAGAALPLALTVAYFAIHGSARFLVELLAAQSAYSRGRLPGVDTAIAHDWAKHAMQPALWLCAVPAAISLLQRGVRRRADLPLSAAWFGVSLLVYAVQQHWFYDAIQVLAPLALLAGGPLADALTAAAGATRTRGRLSSRAWVGLGALAALLPVGARYAPVLPYWVGRRSAAEYWSRMPEMPACIAVANYLRARTSPSDRVLVYAFQPTIYFLANRVSPTRHFHSYLIFGTRQIPVEVRARWLAELRHDVARRPPAYLVTEDDPVELALVPKQAATAPAVGEANRAFLGGHSFVLAAWVGNFSIYRLEPDRPGAQAPADDDFASARRDLQVLARDADD